MSVTRWEQGRADIDRLITQGRLERVTPNQQHAQVLLEQARKAVQSAAVRRPPTTPSPRSPPPTTPPESPHRHPGQPGLRPGNGEAATLCSGKRSSPNSSRRTSPPCAPSAGCDRSATAPPTPNLTEQPPPAAKSATPSTIPCATWSTTTSSAWKARNAEHQCLSRAGCRQGEAVPQQVVFREGSSSDSVGKLADLSYATCRSELGRPGARVPR